MRELPVNPCGLLIRGREMVFFRQRFFVWIAGMGDIKAVWLVWKCAFFERFCNVFPVVR